MAEGFDSGVGLPQVVLLLSFTGHQQETCHSPHAHPEMHGESWCVCSQKHCCFLAGCLPLLMQVAITHLEYLVSN